MPENQRIDTQKVRKAGQDIISYADQMYKVLEGANDHVKETESYFKSDGGNEIRKNFYQSAQKFTEFRKFLKEYGEYLISYADMTEGIDTQIQELGKKIPKL